jgi:Mrp family chromosome partitioning ATPase
MLGRRARLPVLAEIGAAPDGSRVWSLRRTEMEQLEAALPTLTAQQVLFVSGEGPEPLRAAVALAASAAAGGRRTALLECDVVSPRLAAALGLAPEPGLHEYLRWEAEPPQLLQPVALGGSAAAGAAAPLICIVAGRPASNPTTLFGLQSFAHMCAKLRAAYDLLVLAGPPAFSEAAAAAAAARYADAVVAGLAAADASGRAGQPIRAAVRRLPPPALGAIAIGGRSDDHA